jgi:hypothetical protein
MIIDVFNKIYNGAATSTSSPTTNQTSRLMNLTTSATIETPPLHNSKPTKFAFPTSFLNINNYNNNDNDEIMNQSRHSSNKSTNGIRKSFNNFYLLNEANEKDRIYSAKYNINLFNSKSKPINVEPLAPRLPQSLPPSHNISTNTQECPDHECCSLNNDAILTLTSTDDKAKIEELIKRNDLRKESEEGVEEKDREFLEADMKSITDDATTLLLSTPNKLNADGGGGGGVEEEEEEDENYYHELLTNDERKGCSYDLGRLDTKKDESTMNHYEEIDKHERQDACEGDDDCMYSTLSEEEEEEEEDDDDEDDDSAGSSSASSSSFNSTSTPASCTSHSSKSRNDTMSIEVIAKEEQCKKVSNLKRCSTNTNATNADKINFKKCIFKSSKLAQKKRVKRIFLISTITNSKFNFLANQKNRKKREGGVVEADIGKVKETKESVKPKTQSKTCLQEAKTVRENEMMLGDDEEIADENQASGIELNARADDFYFEYDFDYDLNEQIKSSDEDFTLYSYNDLLNNNNNNNNNTASNIGNMKNDIDSNHAVNGNSSYTSKTDEQDDEEDNVEDEEEDEEEEEEEEEENDEVNGNGDENERNNESDGCFNEQDEIEQEKAENTNNEAVEKPKEKKSKELNLIVHRLPGL